MENCALDGEWGRIDCVEGMWGNLGRSACLDGAEERERFVAEILPRLAEVPLSRIVKATGVSLRYASMIRGGLYIAYPMHYDALSELVQLRDYA